MNSDSLFVSIILFELFFTPIVSSMVTLPGLPNPMCDLTAAFGTAIGPCGSNTIGTAVPGTPGSQQAQISQGQAATQGCVGSAVPGAAVGAAIGVGAIALGAVTFGLGTLAVLGIGGALIGATAGCIGGATVWTSSGQGIYNTLTNLPGGDFFKGLAAVMQFVPGFISFATDSVLYEFGMFAVVPELAVFLFPLQAIGVIWSLVWVGKFVRGLGALG